MAGESIVGKIALELGVNTKDFKKQLSGLGNTAKSASNGITKSLGGIAKAAAVAFSVKAIVNFGKECLELGSDLAEVQNVVDVTFGSMSEKVNEWAKAAMESYGLSEKVAKEYMGQFGAMSKAFGNTEQMAYDQAAALTGLAGDVASFYNMTTDEAFSKLKAVYTGETEGLKSLGVVMTQTALEEYAVQQGIGKTISAMSEQEKVALRLSFVQDKLAGASGDFARTADGWANQTRVLSLRFDALKASIGQGLINILTPVIRLLNQLVAYLQVAADAFSNFTTMLFGDSGGSTSSAVSSMADASGAISENLGDSASAAKAIKKSLAGFDQINVLGGGNSGGGGSTGGALSSSLGSDLESSESKAVDGVVGKLDSFLKEAKKKLVEFSNLSGLKNFWNKFIEGTGHAKTGILNLFESFKGAIAENAPNFEALKTSLSNTFLTMFQTLTTIWGDIWLTCTSAFASFTEENGPAIQEFFSGIIGTVTGASTLISDIVGDLYGSLLEWWNTSGKAIWEGIVECLTDIGAWFLRLWNEFVQPVIDWVTKSARELWEEYLKPLWDKLLDLITSIWNVIKLFWDNVLKPLVDWILNNFIIPIKDAVMAFVTIIKNVIGTLATILGGIIDTLKAVLDFVVDGFTNGWNGAWEKLKKKFVEIWDGVKNTVAKPLNGILSGIEAFINAIISAINILIRAINSISFEVPDWVPLIGGKKLGFNLNEVSKVSLPRLATGGYVAANTPQLAIVGDNKREGEIIAPESKIAEAVAQGFAMVMNKFQTQSTAQNNRPMYVTLKLGEDTFWEGFVDYHNSIVKRTGETPLMV